MSPQVPKTHSMRYLSTQTEINQLMKYTNKNHLITKVFEQELLWQWSIHTITIRSLRYTNRNPWVIKLPTQESFRAISINIGITELLKYKGNNYWDTKAITKMIEY